MVSPLKVVAYVGASSTTSESCDASFRCKQKDLADKKSTTAREANPWAALERHSHSRRLFSVSALTRLRLPPGGPVSAVRSQRDMGSNGCPVPANFGAPREGPEMAVM